MITISGITISGSIQVSGSALSAPNAPINLSPTNGYSRTFPNPTLSWDNGGGALSYDVYFDTSNPPTTLVSSAQSGTTYTASTSDSTVYYWKIVARNNNGTASTSVYSFTTATPYLANTFTSFEAGTIGQIPTVQNLIDGTVGTVGTWTLTSNANTYALIGGSNTTLYNPVRVGSTTYTGTGTRSVKFRMDQLSNYARNDLSANANALSFSCWLAMGPDANSQTIDFIELDTAAGGFLILQMTSTGQLQTHWDKGGAGSGHGTPFTIAADTVYRIEIVGVRHSDTSYLKVYNTSGTLVGSDNFLLSQGYDSPFVSFRFGRCDSHSGGNPPDTSWAEFDGMAWSTSGTTPFAP